MEFFGIRKTSMISSSKLGSFIHLLIMSAPLTDFSGFIRTLNLNRMLAYYCLDTKYLAWLESLILGRGRLTGDKVTRHTRGLS